MTEITIAIDAMGGDYGVQVTVPASIIALRRNHLLKLILVGDSEAIKHELKANNFVESERLVIRHSSQVVSMDEEPAKALRFKKDSSMRVAVNIVKEKLAQACVSAGNTGALMATAHYVLKSLPGVDRPAIISTLPTLVKNKTVTILDLGANADSSPDHLYQFAIMGAVLASAHNGIDILKEKDSTCCVDSCVKPTCEGYKPKVGLLNIGSEDIKGNELVKAADKLFSKSQFFNYVGYIEGDCIFKGIADVIVCDGFVGNVALKSIEGTIKLILHYAKLAFSKNIFTKLAAFIAMPVFNQIKKQMDPGRYNGASFIGLNGIVIKSHGGANEMAFANAIYEAILEVEKDIPQKIGEKVSLLLKREPLN